MYGDSDLGVAPQASNHSYSISNEMTTMNWVFFIDGVYKFKLYSHSFNYGTPQVSSERNSIYDSNYSHFWGMQYKRSDNTWTPFKALNSYMAMDLDPEYNYRKVSNTEGYVEIP